MRKYCAIYLTLLSCNSQLFIRTSQHFDSVQFHLREDTYTRLVLYDININKIIRIRTRAAANPRAKFSSERTGLAGWYCRAGCGRSSHFGDEISLSNPAPCFIYPKWLECVLRDGSHFFTSFNKLTNYQQLLWRDSLLDLPRRKSMIMQGFFIPMKRFCIFIWQKSYTIHIYIIFDSCWRN